MERLIFVTSNSTSIRSFKIAADNGNDYAECRLGKIYLYGKDVPRDSDKAMYYLHLAADHDNQYAAQLIHSIKVNGNWTAALASLRLLGHMARIIQNHLEDERKSRGNSIDRKLRRQTDLVALLQSQGEHLKRSGKEYEWCSVRQRSGTSCRYSM
ncbi:SEL1-like repeat protein [Bovifimicola ammoniilytica]|uniref:hypothetical protein n=1 Tax=Bovifimicola ammoniilytica TaxID=2981720 RepID=UPI00374C9105